METDQIKTVQGLPVIARIHNEKGYIEVHPHYHKMSYMAQDIMLQNCLYQKTDKDIYSCDLRTFEHFTYGLGYRVTKVMFHFIEAIKNASLVNPNSAKLGIERLNRIKNHYKA